MVANDQPQLAGPYCFFGADAQRFPAYGSVTWHSTMLPWKKPYRPSTAPLSTKAEMIRDGLAVDEADEMTGKSGAELRNAILYIRMTNGRDAGVATVPAVPGGVPHHFAPDRVRAELAVTGVDHQGAYSTNNQTVMDFVFYSVCKIARGAA